MRLHTVRTAAGLRAARQEQDELVLLDATDVGALLAESNWRDIAQGGGADRIALLGADFAPVVPKPEKIICVGINYRSHAEETGLAIPDYPTIFAKYGRALIGARDPIVLPRNSVKVDWEAELAVVIGREVRYADESEAEQAIAGYTVANDVSMRDWQARTNQWLQGKTFEASTPVGPALVTLDELDDPSNLRVSCDINGEVMQESWTNELIFSPAAIIAYVSGIITLAPGDVILTGTPGGIGGRRTPPRFLKSGEVLRTTIDGVGELVNVCIDDDGA